MTRAFFLIALLPMLVSGCLYTRAHTESARTATEQLLLTRSVARAVDALVLPDLEGRSIELEVVGIAGADLEYLRAALAEELRARGARLTGDGLGDRVVVAFVEALGTVSRSVEFGVPPIPVAGVATPSIPLVRILKQRAYTGIQASTRDPDQTVLSTSESVLERAYFEVYSLFFLVLRRNDIYPGETFGIGID